MRSFPERHSFTWTYLRHHKARFTRGIAGLLARDAIAVTIPLRLYRRLDQLQLGLAKTPRGSATLAPGRTA